MSIEDKQPMPVGEAFSHVVGSRPLGSAAAAQAGASGGLPPDQPPRGGQARTDSGREPSQHDEAWRKAKTKLRVVVGEDIFSSWFASTEFERFDGRTLTVSAPTKFLKSWIQNHYGKALLEVCKAEFPGIEQVAVQLRQPATAKGQAAMNAPVADPRGTEPGRGDGRGTFSRPTPPRIVGAGNPALGQSGSFDSSPLEAKYTFENFVVGAANRLAHAAAKQVAETILEQPLRFNPLYIHSSVGLGKTHLLHAISWDVKRKHPSAQVLYLTAERFRYHFVGSVMAHDPMTFKDKFRNIDLLLIDDLEFMQGPKTEEEFDHTLNMLLDSGRQVVVASARPPSQLESLDPRMRSRLSGGLVTEIAGLDYDLRLSILERRILEKRNQDPTFEIGRDVLEFLSEKLTESGRDLDGAVTRLHANLHYTGEPITVESAEHIIRDLVHGGEPRRIKIDDILRVVSKHFGVSRGDILSQRRHRSIVRPRQIGMYLAKQLTSRSLPEIGRRFGGRDHTTVLHAIRKIDGEVQASTQLRDEIEDLKRLLNN